MTSVLFRRRHAAPDQFLRRRNVSSGRRQRTRFQARSKRRWQNPLQPPRAKFRRPGSCIVDFRPDARQPPCRVHLHPCRKKEVRLLPAVTRHSRACSQSVRRRPEAGAGLGAGLAISKPEAHNLRLLRA